MTWKTHILGGIQAGLILSAVTNADPSIAAAEIATATIGSILPDIDHPYSKISRSDLLLTATSYGISKFTKHRRATHTVWCSFLFTAITYVILKLITAASLQGSMLVIGILTAVILDFMKTKIGSVVGIIVAISGSLFLDISGLTIDSEYVLPCTAAMFFGCIAHLVYDTFNPQGIMWLHPIKRKRYSLGSIQTESQAETTFAMLMLMVTVVMVIAIMPMLIGTFRLPNLS